MSQVLGIPAAALAQPDEQFNPTNAQPQQHYQWWSQCPADLKPDQSRGEKGDHQ